MLKESGTCLLLFFDLSYVSASYGLYGVFGYLTAPLAIGFDMVS